MAIKETPINIKFVWEDKINRGNPAIDVEFSGGGKTPIVTYKQTGNDEAPSVTIPIDFMIEVVDYLREKEAIPNHYAAIDPMREKLEEIRTESLEKRNLSKSYVAGSNQSTSEQPLSLPVINDGSTEGQEMAPAYVPQAPTAPITSFTSRSVDKTSSVSNQEDSPKEESVIQEESVPPAGPVFKSSNEDVSSEQIIKRPVIRSRVHGEDPLSAEKEAAILRGQSDESKTVRRS
jgi:hypothetical protein